MGLRLHKSHLSLSRHRSKTVAIAGVVRPEVVPRPLTAAPPPRLQLGHPDGIKVLSMFKSLLAHRIGRWWPMLAQILRRERYLRSRNGSFGDGWARRLENQDGPERRPSRH